jgi:hypothetical protein
VEQEGFWQGQAALVAQRERVALLGSRAVTVEQGRTLIWAGQAAEQSAT